MNDYQTAGDTRCDYVVNDDGTVELCRFTFDGDEWVEDYN